MLFIATCADKSGALQLRLDSRAAHLDYLKSLGDKVRAAGALLGEDGAPSGSLLIFAAETRAEVDAWLAGDPYAKAGLFVSVEVKPWRQAVGVALA